MLFTGQAVCFINLIIIRYLCDVKNRLGIPSVTVAVILAVVLLNIVVFYYTPLYGDDLTYKSFFEGPSTRWTGPLGWLRWLWMHWNSINGRLGNFVIIPLLALPQGLRAVVAAVSGVISVLSTYEGRSGMFAQLFALTFLTAFYGARVRLPQWGRRIIIAAGIVLPLVVEGATALECRRLWPAHQRLLELYLASPDGSFVFEEAAEPSPVAMLRPYPAPPFYDEALIPPLEHLYGKPPRIILKPCR